ncbi:MAG: glycosyltransferase [Candidatus Omnitrophica bacterium]|nr:glycosyltransferase [Candidatus Omnitrophota bacterium]
MKILYAHRYDPKFLMGGAAHVVFHLALAMKEYFHEEVACAVNSCDLATKLTSYGVTVYEIPWKRSASVQMVWRLKSILREFQPDIVHSHHRYLTFLSDVFLKRQSRILHTEHVLRHDRRLLFRYGHHATAVSESVRKNLIEYYKVPQDRVDMISNAVSLRPLNYALVDSLRCRYAGERKMIALCVGRLDEQKGHTYMFDAIARLPEASRSKIKILLAGDGKLKTELQEKTNRLKIGDCVEYLGYTDDIPELLHLCDFLILPSLWEGLPLVVLEAFQAGKPVIATDIPGTKEVMLQNRTGILVPPRDSERLAAAIQEFLNDPKRLIDMGPAIAEHAQQFSFPTMVKRYHELYRRLCAQYAVG